MARNGGSSGCGCVAVLVALPVVAGIVAVPGMILAAPAIVVFLLGTEPGQLAAHPSWWAGAALAPVVAYVTVRLAAHGKAHAGQRIHVNRAGLLTLLSTAATLAALVAAERLPKAPVAPSGTDASAPPAGGPSAAPTAPVGDPTAADPLAEAGWALPLAAPFAATAVAVLFVVVLRLLDRRVPDRVVPRVPAPRTHLPEPEPGEIWWGEVEFREGTGSKDRPFVILRVLPGHVEILQITSQDKSHRSDHIPFRTDSTDVDAVWDGYLELRVRELSRWDLRRRDNAWCPDEIWARVRSLRAPARNG